MSSEKDTARESRRKHSLRSRNYNKLFTGLPKDVQEAQPTIFKQWCENPAAKGLDQHALGGRSKGYYSIKVSGKRYVAVYSIFKKDDVDYYVWEWIGTHEAFNKQFPK